MFNRVLVITSCTKDKVISAQVSNHSPVKTDQLWDDRNDDRALRHFGELEQYRVPAASLYHGLQHTELMQGVELLRRTFGQACIDVKIISAGFGVVDEYQPLPFYEATFADQSQSSVRALSRRLRIPQTISALVRDSYDCTFFLLGEAYLLSLGLPWAFDPSFPCLFLASPNDRTIPRRHPYALIPAGKDEGSAFHYGLVGLKGHLFRLFAEQVTSLWTKNQAFQSCTTASARLESFLSTPTPQLFLRSIRPVQESRRVVPAPDSLVVQQSFHQCICTGEESEKLRQANEILCSRLG